MFLFLWTCKISNFTFCLHTPPFDMDFMKPYKTFYEKLLFLPEGYQYFPPNSDTSWKFHRPIHLYSNTSNTPLPRSFKINDSPFYTINVVTVYIHPTSIWTLPLCRPINIYRKVGTCYAETTRRIISWKDWNVMPRRLKISVIRERSDAVYKQLNMDNKMSKQEERLKLVV